MGASKSESENSGLKAFRNATLAVALLLLFTPFRLFAILFVLVIGLLAILKYAYAVNRNLGGTLSAIVLLASASYVYLQYSVNNTYQRLLSDLSEFEDVTIRREMFPFPKIPQLSIGDGVSDAQLSKILDMKGLNGISELYLDNGQLTDASLSTVATKCRLTYIFIDCDKITDSAILDFMNQSPDCTVIPYKRDLHDDGVAVYLEQPPDGD